MSRTCSHCGEPIDDQVTLIKRGSRMVELGTPCDYCWENARCLTCEFWISSRATQEPHGLCWHDLMSGTFPLPKQSVAIAYDVQRRVKKGKK